MVFYVFSCSEGCIDTQLRSVSATGNCKRYPCPTCREETKVPWGKAANLAKNFEVLKMA